MLDILGHCVFAIAGNGYVALLFVTIVAATGWSLRGRFRHPTPLLQSSRWVLVADIFNLTGEPILDGTLEYALEREISNSRYVRVVPRQRVEDALRLMKQPLDSRIDPGLGRELCLRDGEIRALVTGRLKGWAPTMSSARKSWIPRLAFVSLV